MPELGVLETLRSDSQPREWRWWWRTGGERNCARRRERRRRKIESVTTFDGGKNSSGGGGEGGGEEGEGATCSVLNEMNSAGASSIDVVCG